LSVNIIRLECHQEYKYEGNLDTSDQDIPIGTGFFVELENTHSTDNILFVVTARHVAETPCDLHARVQVIDQITKRNETIKLKIDRNRWIYHPSRGDETTHYVDVAVTRIKFNKNKEIIAFRYDPKDAIKSNLPLIDPMPPWPVLVFGFPGEIGFELKEQRPIGRLGIISMVAGEKFLKKDNKYVDEKAYIIDSNVFKGNSGGPVINQIVPIGHDKVVLWGLISRP